MPDRRLTPALEIDGDGAHPASWRRAAHPPTELHLGLRPARSAQLALAARHRAS